jgi:hypothetical protein
VAEARQEVEAPEAVVLFERTRFVSWRHDLVEENLGELGDGLGSAGEGRLAGGALRRLPPGERRPEERSPDRWCRPHEVHEGDWWRRFHGEASACQLCFGVRKYPFTAHSWVETHGDPLDDDPGRRAGYTASHRVTAGPARR